MLTRPIASIAICSIRPRPFRFAGREWIRSNLGCGPLGCLGCAIPVLAVLAGGLVAVQLPADDGTLAWETWLWASGGVGLLGLVLGSGTNYRMTARRALVKEAETLTSNVRRSFDDMRSQVAVLRQASADADDWLDQATGAFEGIEYGAFWEAIENASKALAAGQIAQAALATDIDFYVTSLQEREHDFPEWCTELTPLRDLRPLLDRLLALKRQADTRYEFASIREMRDTRYEIVKGFANLSSAIQHLEVSVVDSCRQLGSAIERSALLRAASPAVLQIVAGVFLERR